MKKDGEYTPGVQYCACDQDHATFGSAGTYAAHSGKACGRVATSFSIVKVSSEATSYLKTGLMRRIPVCGSCERAIDRVEKIERIRAGRWVTRRAA